jgi:hypothetical protein
MTRVIGPYLVGFRSASRIESTTLLASPFILRNNRIALWFIRQRAAMIEDRRNFSLIDPEII